MGATNNQVIVLTQAPIVKYDGLDAISKDVQQMLENLDINSLEATEDNLKRIKEVKATLNKDYEIFEGQRKLVKESVMKPYNDFETHYKEKIAGLFKNAETTLKNMVDTIEGRILTAKINGIKDYFAEQNTYDFISFEHMGLKVIKSRTDKAIKEDIDTYLANVAQNLATIDTMPNKERILAKYQLCRDLNRAISDVNIELQREELIKKRNEETKAQEAIKPIEVPKPEIKQEVEQVVIEEQVFSCTFTVTATKEQLRSLKQFMKDEGIKYD